MGLAASVNSVTLQPPFKGTEFEAAECKMIVHLMSVHWFFSRWFAIELPMFPSCCATSSSAGIVSDMLSAARLNWWLSQRNHRRLGAPGTPLCQPRSIVGRSVVGRSLSVDHHRRSQCQEKSNQRQLLGRSERMWCVLQQVTKSMRWGFKSTSNQHISH